MSHAHMAIDKSRHVLPLASTERALRYRLQKRFGAEPANEIWTRACRIYERFVEDMPYTGGSHNPHAHSLYDSVMCFAVWEAMPEDNRESVEDFTNTIALVFNGCNSEGDSLGSGMPLGGMLRTLAKKAPWIVHVVAPVIKVVFAPENWAVRRGKWSNAWEMKVNETKPEGCLLHVELVGCPIVDFARSHGYLHLMPAMCNPDYAALAPLGLHYVRPKTVAMGHATCDQYLYPPDAAYTQSSPVRTDDEGFLYNELPQVTHRKPVSPRLPITWKYFNVIAPLIRHFLQKRYGYDMARHAYEGARPIYRELIDACPPVGAGNPMAKNLYEACVFFALYRSANGEVTPSMMRAAANDLFAAKPAALIGSVMDLRKPGVAAQLTARMRANATWVEERPEVKPYSWDFTFDDDKGGTVVHYHFTHCPLNDFAREQGLMDMLPVMCDIDYKTAQLMHGRLTRHHTLAAGGPMCDYLIEPEPTA